MARGDEGCRRRDPCAGATRPRPADGSGTRLNLASTPDLTIEEQRLVWNGRCPLRLVRFRHRRFDGTMSGERNWELWERGRAGAVLPYDPHADKVLLIEQFRLPAYAAGMAPVLTETPAGFCDKGEEPEAAVRRETREEAGLTLGRVMRVGDFLLSPGGTDERCTIFIGEMTAPATGPGGVLGDFGLAAEQEDIQVRIVAADHAIERAMAGELPNAVTSIAVLWLAARRASIRRDWA